MTVSCCFAQPWPPQLGVEPRTLANWADAGILAAITTVGGHRRYRAADVTAMIDRARHQREAHSERRGNKPVESEPIGHSRGSFARRGRALTEAEVAKLAAAPSVHKWAELAASFQANGSSIRQIAAATGTLPATVAARISRRSQSR